MINEELLAKTIEEVMNLVEDRFNHVSPEEYAEAMRAIRDELDIHLEAASDFKYRNSVRLMKDVTKQICEDEDNDTTRTTESAQRD